VLVRGERIESVSRRAGTLRGDRQIRGGGATLMSGLCDAHTHFSWNDAPSLNHLGTTPPEDHTVFAVKAARTYIDMGYTMCVGASSAKMRLDVVIRDAINDGTIPGPRLLACCTEFSTPEGTLLPGASIVVSGPGEFRAAASEVIELGVDVIKIICSGEEITGTLRANDTYVTEEELAAVVEVAHARGRKVSVHARSTESIKRCPGRASISCIMQVTSTKRGWTCSKRARTASSWRRASTGSLRRCMTRRPGATRPRRRKLLLMRASSKLAWSEFEPCAVVAFGIAGWRLRLCVLSARNLRARFEALRRSLCYTPAKTLRAATVWGGQMMGRPNELGKVARDTSRIFSSSTAIHSPT